MGTFTNTQAIAALTTRLISKTFAYNQTENPPEYTQVFDAETMDQRVVEEAEIIGTGFASFQPEGRPVNYDGVGIGYIARYRALAFGIGTQVTREAIRDNLHEKGATKSGVFLETSMRQTKEWFHAQVFNDANILGGDGVPLLHTQHPTRRGGLQSNTLAIPSHISESALEELLIMIRMMKDGSGLQRHYKPMKIVIHPAQEYNTRRILQSVQRVGTTDNDINVIKAQGIFGGDPVMLTFLSNPNFWGIKTNCPDGLKTMQRDPLELTMNVDPDTGAVKSSAWERYARGWTNWRGFAGSNPP